MYMSMINTRNYKLKDHNWVLWVGGCKGDTKVVLISLCG